MMPYKQNFERGNVVGAYVPPAILKQQEHQRAKLAKDFRNRPVFLETKIEVETVNKPVAKKLSSMPNQEEKPAEMIFDTGAYLPSFVIQRQEFDRAKNEVDLKELKSLITVEPEFDSVITPVKNLPPKPVQEEPSVDMVWLEGAYVASSTVQQQEHDRLKIGTVPVVIKNPADIHPLIFEEKPVVYSDKVQKYNLILPTKVARKIAKSVEILRGSKPEWEIGQEYLADCGLDAHWVFKCAPWKVLPICVDDESDGAWVPFIVLYRVDYFECKYVKEQGSGREFSQDHGEAYN